MDYERKKNKVAKGKLSNIHINKNKQNRKKVNSQNKYRHTNTNKEMKEQVNKDILGTHR